MASLCTANANINQVLAHKNICGIVDVACSVGEMSIDNSSLEQDLNLEKGYISRRTGIESRYYKAKETSFFDLAKRSLDKLLEKTGINPSQISVFVCASSTFDKNSPSLACQLMNSIDNEGLNQDCFAVDINSACTGYIYALSIAVDKLLVNTATGEKKFAIVVTNEVFSDYLGSSPNSDILFGDASSATLLEVASDVRENWLSIIHSFHQGSVRDPKNSIVIYNESGIGKMSMDGMSVYENAVKSISRSIRATATLHGIALADVDNFILHQANKKIVDTVCRKLELESDKFFCNISHYGNTGASSIPICLESIFNTGSRHDKDSYAILSAFGSGFTYGSVLLTMNVY